MPVSKVLCLESKSEIFLSSSVSLPLGGLRLFSFFYANRLIFMDRMKEAMKLSWYLACCILFS